MKQSFYEERQKTVRKILDQLMDYFDGKKSTMTSSEVETVEATLQNLIERYSYNEESAREAVAFLKSNRYKD
jgi:hypothetical protein